MEKYKSIDEIREFDSKFFNDLDPRFTKLLRIAGESEQGLEFSILLGLIKSVNDIKLSILDLGEYSADHCYVLNILLRAQIEHHLKLQFVVHRMLSDKDDSVFTEYTQHLSYKELRDLHDAATAVGNADARLAAERQIHELKLMFPDTTFSYSKSQKVSATWSYKKIISYIIKSEGNTTEANLSFCNRFLLDYATLSSFVHGGFLATRFNTSHSKPGSTWDKEFEIAKKAIFLSAATQLLAFLPFLKIHKGLGIDLLELAALMEGYIDRAFSD